MLYVVSKPRRIYTIIYRLNIVIAKIGIAILKNNYIICAISFLLQIAPEYNF